MFKKGLKKFEVVETDFSIDKVSEDGSLNWYQAVLSTAGEKLNKICSKIPESLKSKNNCLIVPFEQKIHLIKPKEVEIDLQDVETCLGDDDELI